MSEGFKMRELVHAGDQAGVPSNIRAAAAYAPKLEWKSKDPELRAARVLEYIRDHKGEIMGIRALGAAAGYANPAVASKLVSNLIKKGKLVRTKVVTGERGVRYTYIIPAKPDPRQNGPVSVHYDKSLIEKRKQAYEKVGISPASMADAEARLRYFKAEKDGEFIARLNMEAWKYLTGLNLNPSTDNQFERAEARLGREALVLKSFINSLSEGKGEHDGREGNVPRSEEASGNDQA